ncbi:MAG TPA: branched-chain amino acid aminotransferase [Acidocella sp.]|uniref:branched-chain amino acid aminotransferase n=1 Tax=Acidocella sp. TaxID=50710 RepID=UPI002CF1414C|nr:branched-chain amino acid aminotransferase [Acidocella sp.]HVE21623.1 branched-chain amino acid aminotransferase [Acidocella sp.]
MASDLSFAHIPNAAPVAAAQRASLLENPGFGTLFTDHMAVIEYTQGIGWHDARIQPRETIALHPAAAVLHYAQEIFEGLKAYRLPSGEIVMFRPTANAKRFQESADRMAMPPLPPELFMQSLEQLIRVDRDWVPNDPNKSLYLRPFMFANEAFLGVRPAKTYIYAVIASPVGGYFKGGAEAVSVWVSERYSRAAAGGTGAAKCGGNYAASLLAQSEASAHACDQVAFLDAAEHRWLEEMGGMNMFFVFDDGSLLTPPLGGTILPGITRESLITLARAAGMQVREERYSFQQWREDAASGRLREAFACGTAAVVTPIGKIKFAGGQALIGDGEHAGAITKMLKDSLVKIQRGQAEDPYGWVHRVA